jgi:hypothetical protein
MWIQSLRVLVIVNNLGVLAQADLSIRLCRKSGLRVAGVPFQKGDVARIAAQFF